MTEEQRQLAIDYQTTFDTPHGRRVKDDLMKLSGYNEGVDPSSVNAGMVMFLLGGREMYLYIKERCEENTAAPVQQEAAKVNAAVNQENVQQETAEE